MRGPGKLPPARTAAREKPSGEISALVISKSVTGPIAAFARIDRASTVKVSKELKLNILLVEEKGRSDRRKEHCSKVGIRVQCVGDDDDFRKKGSPSYILSVRETVRRHIAKVMLS